MCSLPGPVLLSVVSQQPARDLLPSLPANNLVICMTLTPPCCLFRLLVDSNSPGGLQLSLAVGARLLENGAGQSASSHCHKWLNWRLSWQEQVFLLPIFPDLGVYSGFKPLGTGRKKKQNYFDSRTRDVPVLAGAATHCAIWQHTFLLEWPYMKWGGWCLSKSAHLPIPFSPLMCVTPAINQLVAIQNCRRVCVLSLSPLFFPACPRPKWLQIVNFRSQILCPGQVPLLSLCPLQHLSNLHLPILINYA